MVMTSLLDVRAMSLSDGVKYRLVVTRVLLFIDIILLYRLDSSGVSVLGLKVIKGEGEGERENMRKVKINIHLHDHISTNMEHIGAFQTY